MTGSLTLGTAIEIVVAILLVLTIFYCAVLNRRLTRLRADEEVLRATISELITATEIAERAIFGLKATANECERSLGGRMQAAEDLLGNLDQHLSAGNEIVKRIGAIVGAAAPAPALTPASRAEAPVVHPNRPVEAPRETTARSLQLAAEAAAERLAALRRGQREEAA